jgi:hypothetical protein
MDAVRTVSRVLTRGVVTTVTVTRAIVAGIRSVHSAAGVPTDRRRADPPLTALGG